MLIRYGDKNMIKYMTYEKAAQLIENLNEDYHVVFPKYEDESYDFQVYYVSTLFATIPNKKIQKIITFENILKLKKGYSLWMILSQLAITPIKKRRGKQYNVVIVNNPRKTIAYPFEVWMNDKNGFFLSYVTEDELKNNLSTHFNEGQYNQLINYIKTLPDGEFQAKVAEHGKKEIK